MMREKEREGECFVVSLQSYTIHVTIYKKDIRCIWGSFIVIVKIKKSWSRNGALDVFIMNKLCKLLC